MFCVTVTLQEICSQGKTDFNKIFTNEGFISFYKFANNQNVTRLVVKLFQYFHNHINRPVTLSCQPDNVN